MEVDRRGRESHRPPHGLQNPRKGNFFLLQKIANELARRLWNLFVVFISRVYEKYKRIKEKTETYTKTKVPPQ